MLPSCLHLEIVLGFLCLAVGGSVSSPQDFPSCRPLRNAAVHVFKLYDKSEAKKKIRDTPLPSKANGMVCFPEGEGPGTCCTPGVEEDFRRLLHSLKDRVAKFLREKVKELDRLKSSLLAMLDSYQMGIKSSLEGLASKKCQKEAVGKLTLAFTSVFNGILPSIKPALKTYYHEIGVSMFSAWWMDSSMKCDTEICTLVNWTLPVTFPCEFNASDPLKVMADIGCCFDSFLISAKQAYNSICSLQETISSIERELLHMCRYCRKEFLPRLMCHLCKPGEARHAPTLRNCHQFVKGCYGRIVALNKMWNSAVKSTIDIIEALDVSLCPCVRKLEDSTRRILQEVEKQIRNRTSGNETQAIFAGLAIKILNKCCHTTSSSALLNLFFGPSVKLNCTQLHALDSSGATSADGMTTLLQKCNGTESQPCDNRSLCKIKESLPKMDLEVLYKLLDYFAVNGSLFRPFCESAFVLGQEIGKKNTVEGEKIPTIPTEKQFHSATPIASRIPSPPVSNNDIYCQRDKKYYEKHHRLNITCCTNMELLLAQRLKQISDANMRVFCQQTTKDEDGSSPTECTNKCRPVECNLPDYSELKPAQHPWYYYLFQGLKSGVPDS
eukprot:m.229729 g.229729  ORF g.229729 m.229729 type:complete len:610 (+) comp40049_c0_seq34:94-1923(+)